VAAAPGAGHPGNRLILARHHHNHRLPERDLSYVLGVLPPAADGEPRLGVLVLTLNMQHVGIAIALLFVIGASGVAIAVEREPYEIGGGWLTCPVGFLIHDGRLDGPGGGGCRRAGNPHCRRGTPILSGPR
jgi:hypothetical protein